MTSSLLSLPDDVLIVILVALRARDLISISLTCRALYVFCRNTDYIWHAIDIDLPLNLPHEDIGSISADELRRHCVEGLRVEHNWHNNPPNLKALSRIDHGGIIDQMQCLPPRWLVSMARVSTGLGPRCVLSIWDCDIPGHAKKIESISLEPRGLSRFAARLSDDRTHLSIVLFGSARAEIVRVYHIPLQAEHRDDSNKYITSRVMADSVVESVFEADIYGEVVSCLLARFETEQPVYQIMILNVKSGKHMRIHVDVPATIVKLQIRLFPGSLLLLSGVQGPRNIFLKMYAYDMTNSMRELESSYTDSTSSPRQNLGTSCAEYNTAPFGGRSLGVEYQLSKGHLSTISALVFTGGTNNQIIRFPIHSDNNGTTTFQQQNSLQTFTFPRARDVEVYPESTALGLRGRRAVWLERKRDEDSDRMNFNLMKGSFPSNQSGALDVGPLLSEHKALPFGLDTCLSVAFDEAKGRVFLGLYTGDIYVLDF
ncbi:hypothetical protein C8R42DRAFT_683471 [Lentinula raphanica]|nr:hypothetical protein C8R42DRAFT_683471 [Lentinula raphanica]